MPAARSSGGIAGLSKYRDVCEACQRGKAGLGMREVRRGPASRRCSGVTSLLRPGRGKVGRLEARRGERHPLLRYAGGVPVGLGEGDPAGIHEIMTDDGGGISHRWSFAFSTVVESGHDQVMGRGFHRLSGYPFHTV